MTSGRNNWLFAPTWNITLSIPVPYQRVYVLLLPTSSTESCHGHRSSWMWKKCFEEAPLLLIGISKENFKQQTRRLCYPLAITMSAVLAPRHLLSRHRMQGCHRKWFYSSVLWRPNSLLLYVMLLSQCRLFTLQILLAITHLYNFW